MKLFRSLLLLSLTVLCFPGCQKDDLEEEQLSPIADFSYIVAKDGNDVTVSFRNKSEHAESYQWLINNSYSSIKTDITIKVKRHKKISVSLTATNQFGKATKSVNIELPLENNTVKGVSYSWWCDPISQFHNGFNYFSGIDTLGRQIIHLYHPQLNTTISKVINSGHRRDEHNTASFIFSGDKILSSCAGHDQESIVKIKMFDSNLNGDFIFETSVSFPGTTSYSQLQRCGNRIFLATRCISKWYISWSDDEGATWATPKLFIKKKIRPNNSFYMRIISVKDNQLKIGAYMHPDDMKYDGQKLFYASMNSETGEIQKEDGTSLGNIYDSSYEAFDIFDMTLVLQSEIGETFRFLDIANIGDGENTAFLIADAKSNDFEQGNYTLLNRDHKLKSTKTTSIVAHGKSLPHPTYWGGAYFVLDNKYKWNEKDIFLARENQSNWMVEKYTFNGESFQLVKQIEKYYSKGEISLSRPLPPLGSEQGGLSVIYQKGLYYGWPSYTNWTNMKLIMVDATLNPINNYELEGEIIEI